MIKTLADPWLAQNAGRKYPLADDVDTTIPDNAILDFRCTVRGVRTGAVPVARIYSIGSRNDPALGFVKYGNVEVLDGSDMARIGTLQFDVPRNLAAGTHYTAVANNGDVHGELTVSDAFTAIPHGAFDAVFARTTVVVDSLGVDSVTGARRASYGESGPHHIDGTEDAVMSGEIVLDLGANTDPYLDGNRLRLEITKGGGRGEWCQRPDAEQTCDNVLFTVNGERPGSDGDIRLTGSGGITVKALPAEHAVEIAIDPSAGGLMTKDCAAVC